MKSVEKFLLNSFYTIHGMNFYFIGAVAFVLLGEVHTLWAGDNSQADWFLLLEYQEYKQWLVRDISNMCQVTLLAWMLYCKTSGRSLLKKIMLALLLYTILDMIMFFVNMKQGYYGLCYIILCVCLIFNSNIKDLFSRK